MAPKVSDKTIELRALVQVDPQYEWIWNSGKYWYFISTPKTRPGYYQIRSNLKHPTHPGSYLSRVIWAAHYGSELSPDILIDHRDGNPFCNVVSNLRQASIAENCRNSQIYRSNTSGYKGVSWHRQKGAYRAYIVLDRKQIHLGLFDTPTEAALAYNKAALKYHGEFARLNTIEPEALV